MTPLLAIILGNCSLGGWLLGSSLAAQTPTRPKPAANATIAAHLPGGSRCMASQLISSKILSASDEELGELIEIVLDAHNQRLAYAIAHFFGVSGMEGKHFALPWRVLEFAPRKGNDARHATLGIDLASLKAAPSFDHRKWHDMTDPTWIQQVADYDRLLGKPVRAASKEADKLTVTNEQASIAPPAANSMLSPSRLSNRLGMPVVGVRQQPLGELEDLVIDIKFATVDGALISFPGKLGLGEQFVLLPTEALTLRDQQGPFFVPCNQNEFQAMTLAGGNLPPLHNNLWRNRGLEFANRVTAVGSEEPVVGADAIRVNIYADAYDVTKTERFTATILSVGSVRIGNLTEPCMRLRMRSTDGRDRIVFAAPNDFASQAALGLRFGRVVEVTGSPTMFGMQTVLVAGSIAIDGKTAVLRDADGHAVWKSK